MKHSPIRIPSPGKLAAVPEGVIAAAIERLIDALDRREGDPDAEEQGLEDGFVDLGGEGPGCPISDPGGFGSGPDAHEDDENAATEWHTRGKHKDREPGVRPEVFAYSEDSEDDDQDACLASDDDPQRRVSDGLPGDPADTEPNGDEGDYSDGDGGHCGNYGVDQSAGMMLEREASDSLAAADILPRRFPWIDPVDMPDVYGLTCHGTCLEPLYRDGVTLTFSKVGRPEPGDFVAVLFKQGVMPPNEPQGWIKRLVSAGPEGLTFFDVTPDGPLQPFVSVEMLNPPKRFTIPATRIAAIHKCLGEAVRMPNGQLAIPRHLLSN